MLLNDVITSPYGLYAINELLIFTAWATLKTWRRKISNIAAYNVRVNGQLVPWI